LQINPIISAIIPTKNRCITLKRAIESVLMQSYSNIEIIIINDNSNDETDQLISNYLELENVHYIKNNISIGGLAARMKGVKIAKGEYIAFLDDDDEWLPMKLEKQLTILKGNNKIGAVSSWFSVNNGNISYKRKLNTEVNINELMSANVLGGFSLCMVRKTIANSIAKEIKIINNIPSHQDWVFWIEVMLKSNVYVLPENLVIQHSHSGPRISKNYYNNIIGREVLINRYKNHMDSKQLIKHLVGIELLKMKTNISFRNKLKHYHKAFLSFPFKSTILFIFEIINLFFPRSIFYNKIKWRVLFLLRQSKFMNKQIDRLIP